MPKTIVDVEESLINDYFANGQKTDTVIDALKVVSPLARDFEAAGKADEKAKAEARKLVFGMDRTELLKIIAAGLSIAAVLLFERNGVITSKAFKFK